ncbi:MAG TPA: aspartate 1-decarboxylase [Thermoanaerobaculia bacterium]|nr:aspartate 1-decarboxylase [Thermoanaerobaculia bacterium]
MRTLLHAVIQNAIVTSAATLWPVSLRVDAFVLRAAEVLPFEEVEVINVGTGERFRTWIEPAPEGSGEVSVHVGARSPVRTGDTVSILAFATFHEGQTLAHKPRIVALGANNQVVSVGEG